MTIDETDSTSSIGTGGRDAGPQLEQPAQGHQVLGLVVDELGVLAEDVVAARARRVLQPEHGVGVEQVRRAVAAPLVLAAVLQALVREGGAVLRVGGACRAAFSAAMTSMPTPPSRLVGAGEVLVDELLAEADRLERLGAGVGADDVEMPIFDMIFSTPLPSALIRFLTAFSGVIPVIMPLQHELLDGLHREVRVDRATRRSR